MKIFFLKIYLFFKSRLIRGVRLIKTVCPISDLILYTLLFLLWLAYCIVCNRVNYIHDGISETYLRSIWEMRNSIFSSIIVAFAVGAFSRLRVYRKTIKAQHFLYVDSMDDFELLFKAIRDDDVWLYFHALYNQRCFNISMEYIEEILKNIDINDNEIIKTFSVISDRLEKIDYQLKTGMLIVKDDEMTSLYISSAKKNLTDIIIDGNKDKIFKLLNDLYFIIDDLRYIWRRDRELDSIRLKICKEPESDFYMRMWMPEFDIVEAKNWLKEIGVC